MLKPIRRINCSDALVACRGLQEALANWLCEPTTSANDITNANLTLRVATQTEANWLWAFLQKIDKEKSLLSRAQTVAAMSGANKKLLRDWIDAISTLTDQFQANPPVWPAVRPAIPLPSWQAFKELMEAFYEKGLRSGLPYLANGTPVATGGVTYMQFVQEFRNAHRLNSNTDAREVCVFCGGPLDDIEVDHWLAKSEYPLFSVSPDNLAPICGRCNSSGNKGTKPVHDQGRFTDWYHPYLRHPKGSVRLDYDLQTSSIKFSTIDPGDTPKALNLNKLLNLTERWTREFKAEYVTHQRTLIERERRRVNRGQPRHSQNDIADYLQTEQDDLLVTEPYYEIHHVLFTATLEPSRLAAWHAELELVL